MVLLQELLLMLTVGSAVLIYTMGGFGGGSVFLAILVLWGLPPSHAAVGSLLFNILSTGISITRWRTFLEKRFLLLLAGSAPMAFIGGLTSLSIPERTLKLVMGLVIAVSGVITLVLKRPLLNLKVNLAHIVLVGGLVGFLAGLTGIGGGVYIAPIMLLGGISTPKTTAATTTVFIFANSLSGLIPRVNRILPSLLNSSSRIILLLVPVVAALALLGSHIGSRKLTHEGVKKVIGSILVFLGLFLTFY